MATIKVVVIDGQATMRERLRAALESEPGITVVGEATDAKTGAMLLRETRPDVVVMGLADPNFPDMIRRICDVQDSVRVLVLASHAEPAHILRALQAGAHGIVLRRASDMTLVDAVRGVQAGGTFISGEASAALMRDYVRQRGGMEIAASLNRLSQRERQVLDLVVNGQTSSQIAQQLAISPKSVDTYRGRLMKKLGTGDVPALVKFAVENGLIQNHPV